MLECLSLRRTVISRCKTSTAFGRSSDASTCFTARISPVVASMASDTIPNVPRPSSGPLQQPKLCVHSFVCVRMYICIRVWSMSCAFFYGKHPITRKQYSSSCRRKKRHTAHKQPAAVPRRVLAAAQHEAKHERGSSLDPSSHVFGGALNIILF